MAASEEAIAAIVRKEMAAMAEALRGEITQARSEVTDKVEELKALRTLVPRVRGREREYFLLTRALQRFALTPQDCEP